MKAFVAGLVLGLVLAAAGAYYVRRGDVARWSRTIARADSSVTATRNHDALLLRALAQEHRRGDSVIAELSARDREIAQLQAAVRVDTVLLSPPEGGPAVPVAVVPAASYQALATACNRLRNDCREALASERRETALEHERAEAWQSRADSLFALIRTAAPPPNRRHLSAGACGGYSAVLDDKQVHTGPGFTVGASLHF